MKTYLIKLIRKIYNIHWNIPIKHKINPKTFL